MGATSCNKCEEIPPGSDGCGVIKRDPFLAKSDQEQPCFRRHRTGDGKRPDRGIPPKPIVSYDDSSRFSTRPSNRRPRIPVRRGDGKTRLRGRRPVLHEGDVSVRAIRRTSKAGLDPKRSTPGSASPSLRDGASITLEPSAQLERLGSAAPPHTHQNLRRVPPSPLGDRAVLERAHASSGSGINFHPFAKRETS